MKTIFEHIERVKGKPHHIRKKIALTTAAVGTALIALLWLVGNLSLGAFAIAGSSFADSTGQGSASATGSHAASPNVAGAAAATLPSESAPAHIEIVDTTPPPSGSKKAERTVIPF